MESQWHFIIRHIQSLLHLDSGSISLMCCSLSILRSFYRIKYIRNELLHYGLIGVLKSSLNLMEEFSWHFDAKRVAVEIIELLEFYKPGLLDWNDLIVCWLVKWTYSMTEYFTMLTQRSFRGCPLSKAKQRDIAFSSDIYWFGMQVLRVASKTRPWCDTIWEDPRVISRFLSWLGLSKMPVKMTWRQLYSLSEREV